VRINSKVLQFYDRWIIVCFVLLVLVIGIWWGVRTGVLANLNHKTPQGSDSIGVWHPQIWTASWYSIESLKKEGTYKNSKGVMANGSIFKEDKFSCASRYYPLGSILQISYKTKFITCEVTDRIGKRFAETRIDLSRAAFKAIAGEQGLDQGLLEVTVERLR
jgi:hypothetical protein